MKPKSPPSVFSSSSVPASRSNSPPITLPPLNLGGGGEVERESEVLPMDLDEDESSSDEEGTFMSTGARRGKVELPGFKEFEAATRSGR